MAPSRLRPSRIAPLALGLVLAAPLAGCGGKAPPSEVVDRLWVSDMPTGPRDRVDAFVVTEVKKRSAGSFYHGSAYRGAHDSFVWKGKSKDEAVLKLLQDGREFDIRIKSCKPSVGFDRCVRLVGDPTKVVRYQSRKRWAIPRRGKGALDVPAVMHELAEDDEELEALFDEAWD